MGEEVQKVIADHGVMMLMYGPHTTNIVQVTDISLFGIFKLIKSNVDENYIVR
jgi:hypothetical protein